jgi:hypothetical protein
VSRAGRGPGGTDDDKPGLGTRTVYARDQTRPRTERGDGARELGSLSPADALSLVLLYRRAGDEKFERAARRWVRRLQIDHSLRRREVELLRGALVALGSRLDAVALDALLGTCRELRLPRPTLPP